MKKEEIKLETLRCLKRKMASKYNDVEFPMNKAIEILGQTMVEIGI